MYHVQDHETINHQAIRSLNRLGSRWHNGQPSITSVRLSITNRLRHLPFLYYCIDCVHSVATCILGAVCAFLRIVTVHYDSYYYLVHPRSTLGPSHQLGLPSMHPLLKRILGPCWRKSWQLQLSQRQDDVSVYSSRLHCLHGTICFR